MMKLRNLIAQLQEQEQKYGDIEVSIDIIPTDEQPKKDHSRYFHVFGPWFANAQNEQKLSFEFNPDKQSGDWLGITFENGNLQGDFERLERKELQQEVQRERKIDSRKPKF